MGLHGKLVSATEFRAGGDLFHELFASKPHDIPNTSPDVHAFELHEGEFGKPGCIISWKYNHDGKQRFAKQLVETIDEKEKKMVFKMLEGDLMEKYKDFVITLDIVTKNGKDLVTWTFEYETLNEDVEHPITLLAYFISVTKDIETHHLAN